MGSDHDHEDHDPAGEEFPRLEVTKLVGQEESDGPSAFWPTILITAGLGALALGLPTERVLDDLMYVDRPSGFPVLQGLTARLASAVELGPERAGYLLAALFWALSLPVLVGLLRTIGFRTRIALPAALIVVLAPAAWIGATLPSTFSAQLFGSALLAWTLFSPQTGRLIYVLRSFAVFALALCLHPATLILLPAVIWAGLTQRPVPWTNPWRDGWTTGLALLGVAGLTYLVWPIAPRELLWPSDMGGAGTSLLTGLLWAPLAIGTALIGVLGLFFAERAPEESPPPRWLAVWCFMFVVSLFLFPAYPLWSAALLPAAAIGMADWTARESREDLAGPRVAVLLGLQVVLTLSAALYLTATDDYAEWRAVAREQLEPTDFVLTFDGQREYFLQQRFGLDSRDVSEVRALSGRESWEWWADLEEELRTAQESGRRVVIDDFPLPMGAPEFPPELWRIERDFEAWHLIAGR